MRLLLQRILVQWTRATSTCPASISCRQGHMALCLAPSGPPSSISCRLGGAPPPPSLSPVEARSDGVEAVGARRPRDAGERRPSSTLRATLTKLHLTRHIDGHRPAPLQAPPAPPVLLDLVVDFWWSIPWSIGCSIRWLIQHSVRWLIR